MDERLQWIKNHWNQTAGSDWYQSLRTKERMEALVQAPHSAFHPAVYELLGKHCPRLSGLRALLPSSGDNHAAFALAMLGAQVTSADISENQLENAREIADKLGLSIRFVCEDTMQLTQLENDTFDLVYTSNGTLSWIDDLPSMYRNIHRVLKPGGLSILYDVHPFQRPFTGEAWKAPVICKAYSDTLPDCHWRIQDLINAHTSAGLQIVEMAELPAVDASFWFPYDELIRQDPQQLQAVNDWHCNPLSALPAWLALVSRKKEENL